MKYRRWIVLITDLVLFSLGFFLLTNLTRAAPNLTFTVTATTDAVDVFPGDGACETATGNGMCTLRAAIMEANAHIGADIIYLPEALYTLTIAGAEEDSAKTGDLDIIERLTIVGESIDSIVDASGLGDRVLDISATAAQVAISHLTIRNGSSDQGGAIRTNSSLNLDRVSLFYNHASGNGGALYSSARLSLSNSLVSANYSDNNGGGIYALKDLILQNTTIDSNISAWDGGGLFLLSGTTSSRISNSYIYLNFADLNGGGVYNYGAELIIKDSSVNDNYATGSGGGLFLTNESSVQIYNSTIYLNMSIVSGGGISNWYNLYIHNTKLSQNDSGDGGAIANHSHGNITLDNVTINNNSSKNGGGISTFGGIITGQTVIINNNIASTNGGAILNHSLSTTNLNQAEVSYNYAGVNGGGIYNGNNGVINLQDTEVFSNTAIENGGGICNRDSSITIVGSTINSNRGGNGGGIYNDNISIIVNSTISGNQSTYSGGGIDNSGTFKSASSTIANNLASLGEMGLGGGVYNHGGGIFALQNTILFSNHRRDPNNIPDDCIGTLRSEHYNLIGTLDLCSLENQENDLVSINPLLGPLDENGGFSLTHSLQETSPAIDAGNPNGCYDHLAAFLSKDQRGYLRHWDGDGDGTARCDIGAFEYNSRIQFFLPITQK